MSREYAITIKNADKNELQKQLDEAVSKGYKPVANIFIHGNAMCIFMVRAKSHKHEYLIGSGRRVEEITHWVNIEHRNGWKAIDGFHPIEFDNFMYVLVKK